jgi:hypothetical protein
MRFAHGLIREALYESVLHMRRVRVHRQIADALLARPQPDPDALVHHLRQAGDPRLGYWLAEAGTRAWLASAYVTAAVRYEEALPLLTAPDDAMRRYNALTRLLVVHMYRPVSEAYGEEAVRIAEGLGDAGEVAGALSRLGDARAHNGDIASGLADHERALAALAAHPDSRHLGYHTSVSTADSVRCALATILAVVGRLREARGLMEEGAVVYNGYYALGLCAGMLGEPAAARRACNALRATVPATQYRSIGTSWLIELLYAVIPYHADEAVLVREVAAKATAAYAQLGEEVLGFLPGEAGAAALLLHGDWEKALDYLPDVRHSRQSVRGIYVPPLYGMVVRARGERALGWEMVREMFPAGAGTEPGGSRSSTPRACRRWQRRWRWTTTTCPRRSSGWRRTIAGWIGAARSWAGRRGRRSGRGTNGRRAIQQPHTRMPSAPSPTLHNRASRSLCSPPAACSANWTPRRAGTPMRRITCRWLWTSPPPARRRTSAR